MEESSPYVPNSIPPALVVFKSSNYGDAIRMQGPFSSQVADGKELNLSNLSGSTFGLRHMESYGGLPAQLVHLQNPFLHPALDGRLPFGSAGAFRPVVTSSSSVVASVSGDERVKSLPSAFTPPSSRRKLDPMDSGGVFHSSSSQAPPPPQFSSSSSSSSSQQQQQQQSSSSNSSQSSSHGSSGPMNLEKSYVNGQRHRSISPTNSSTSKDERYSEDYRDDRDDNATPNSDLTDRSSPEESHLLPSKRKRAGGGGGQELGCPVCKMSLRPMELESHLLAEVEQLMCMSRLGRSQSIRLDEPSTSSQDSPSAGPNPNKKENPTESSTDSRWETYHRVRANRHSRLRIKTRRRREESGGGAGSHVTCPVCQIPLHGSNEQLSSHVETCLRKNGDMLDEDEPVDIEGDGDGDGHDMEDYEWIAQRKARHGLAGMSSTYSPLNMTTNSRRRENEENDSLEVVVDGDDSSTYGHAQYTESDIQLSLLAAARSQSPADTTNSTSFAQDTKTSGGLSEEDSNGGDDYGGSNGSHVNQTMIVKALKGRIRELEKQVKTGLTHDGNHCLICMDKYRKPVVSISCWHVHCEACWLRTLGAKKLCPQCNMITSASDLRRIFL